MYQKVYKYSGVMKFRKFLGKFTLILSLISFFIFSWALTRDLSMDAIYACLLMVFVLALNIYVAAYWPDIKVNDTGIELEFLWWILKIPWDNIVAVERAKSMPLFETWYVKVKKLTFIHKLYGLAFLGSAAPIFLIHKNIEKRVDLIQEIKQNIPKHRNSN